MFPPRIGIRNHREMVRRYRMNLDRIIVDHARRSKEYPAWFIHFLLGVIAVTAIAFIYAVVK